MSRERKEQERIAKKLAYRTEREAKPLRMVGHDTKKYVKRILRQLNAMPGKPEEKYLVLLRCSDGRIYSYPIFCCSEGFTAAMQDAIQKHQSAGRPEIEGGMVQGIGSTSFRPPDTFVQMIAMGANVVVTNRLENRKTSSASLFGSFGMGGGR